MFLADLYTENGGEGMFLVVHLNLCIYIYFCANNIFLLKLYPIYLQLFGRNAISRTMKNYYTSLVDLLGIFNGFILFF